MRLFCKGVRGLPRTFFAISLLFFIVSWTLFAQLHFSPPSAPGDQELEHRFPLAWKHIQSFQGKGGGEWGTQPN